MNKFNINDEVTCYVVGEPKTGIISEIRQFEMFDSHGERGIEYIVFVSPYEREMIFTESELNRSQ